nr:MAG TPA: hypothetical protein [Caudoviricetes sp.]DAW67585.1 MAG TPA: hypothetical protein [Caudoviricetes sp.]DAX23536.1 MAG TPA: hypothetical protein [Caudoviricetes sp.]
MGRGFRSLLGLDFPCSFLEGSVEAVNLFPMTRHGE